MHASSSPFLDSLNSRLSGWGFLALKEGNVFLNARSCYKEIKKPTLNAEDNNPFILINWNVEERKSLWQQYVSYIVLSFTITMNYYLPSGPRPIANPAFILCGYLFICWCPEPAIDNIWHQIFSVTSFEITFTSTSPNVRDIIYVCLRWKWT